MKNLIKRVLFGEISLREYIAIQQEEHDFQEKAYLKTKDSLLDITEAHWLLCLEPFVFGVWVKEKEKIEEGCSLLFKHRKGEGLALSAKLELLYWDEIGLEEGTLLLFRTKPGSVRIGNILRMVFLFYGYYRNPKMSYSKFKLLSAAFSFPRRVRLVSFKQEEFATLFPMDLLGEIPGTNTYVLGLRHTNQAVSKMVETQKVVVCEVSAEHKEMLYVLGKHHAEKFPSLEELSFQTFPSMKFGFLLPEWVSSYKELTIRQWKDLGSQMLFLGEVENQMVLRRDKGNLYHIHFLYYFLQKRKGMLFHEI